MSRRTELLILALMLAIFCGVAAVSPVFDDEYYFFGWGERLQASYFDHAPAIAFLSQASHSIFGNTIVAVRLPAILCSLTLTWVTLRLVPSIRVLVLFALSPAYLLGSVILTPDAPQIAMWALYLTWLIKVNERLQADTVRRWDWVLGGVLLGLGILSKYTMGLALIAAVPAFLFSGPVRRWLPGFMAHTAVAFLVTTPILIHNIQQNFAPILFQVRHTLDREDPTLRPSPNISSSSLCWWVVYRSS